MGRKGRRRRGKDERKQGEDAGTTRGPEGMLSCGGTGRKGGSGKERDLRVTQLGMSE